MTLQLLWAMVLKHVDVARSAKLLRGGLLWLDWSSQGSSKIDRILDFAAGYGGVLRQRGLHISHAVSSAKLTTECASSLSNQCITALQPGTADHLLGDVVRQRLTISMAKSCIRKLVSALGCAYDPCAPPS